MKVYIVKYALSKGIFVADAKEGPYSGSVIVGSRIFNCNEWTRTEHDARIKAEQMKQNQIRASERKIEKLEAMSFSNIRDIKYLKI